MTNRSNQEILGQQDEEQDHAEGIRRKEEEQEGRRKKIKLTRPSSAHSVL